MPSNLSRRRFINRKGFIFNALFILFSAQLFAAALAQVDALQSGRELFEKGQFEEALKSFDKSVDEQPTSADCHYWRAKCLASLGREKESTAEFKLTLLFSNDNAIKDECRAALRKSNASIPTGSVHDPDPKTFKLETRKLDWNVQVGKNLQNTLNNQNAQLNSVINGQKSLFRTSAFAHRTGKSLAAELANGPAHCPFALKAEEVRTLQLSDVYIILDHSGSMGARDCPVAGGVAQSRMDWAAEELEGFTLSLERALPHGFTFITFNTLPQIFAIRNANQFANILRSLTSEGGTTLSPALEQAYRLHGAHLNQPLLIAVVTDGQISVDDVSQSIADATKRFPLPNGMFITFAEVGINSGTEGEMPELGGLVIDGKPFVPQGIGLDVLESLRQTAGAAYDPCAVVPFDQLRKAGLGRTLLSAFEGPALETPAALPQRRAPVSAARASVPVAPAAVRKPGIRSK